MDEKAAGRTLHKRKKTRKNLHISQECSTFAVAKQGGAVVQLVRILACHARGRGFESRPHRKGVSPKGLLFLYCRALT